MAKIPWTLEELIDFEASVHRFSDDLRGDTLIQSNIVQPLLESRSDLKPMQQKRLAFKSWSKHRLKEFRVDPSKLWSSAYGMVDLLLTLTAAGLGAAAIFGIIDWTNQSINLGVLLGLALFLPWLLFIVSAIVALASKEKFHMVGLLASLVVNTAMMKLKRADIAMPEAAGTMRKPILRRLFVSLQKYSVVYSLACLVAIVVAIFFMEISIYWETTLTSGMESFWAGLAETLSIPWSWTGFASPSLADVQAIRFSADQGESVARESVQVWAYFCMLSLLVWSCIPRFLFYCVGKMAYRRTLAAVRFEEKRHRQLWRRLFPIALVSQHDEQDDHATCVDVGGFGLELRKVRPFILQKLRLNPSDPVVLGTLDETKEKTALQVIADKAQPVVLCCEATEFSPRALEAMLAKVKLQGNDQLVHFVLLGSSPSMIPSEQQSQQWMDWVDGLADPDVDLFFFEAQPKVGSGGSNGGK